MKGTSCAPRWCTRQSSTATSFSRKARGRSRHACAACNRRSCCTLPCHAPCRAASRPALSCQRPTPAVSSRVRRVYGAFGALQRRMPRVTLVSCGTGPSACPMRCDAMRAAPAPEPCVAQRRCAPRHGHARAHARASGCAGEKGNAFVIVLSGSVHLRSRRARQGGSISISAADLESMAGDKDEVVPASVSRNARVREHKRRQRERLRGGEGRGGEGRGED